ncbi:hypothetical protein [Sphingobium xenophagum]|nr:hypothetical protein [Sphingobium xenophagum]
MIAPPQVQAHNLANAIRTDIGSTLLLCYLAARYRQIRKTGWRVFPIRINAK